MLNTQNIKGKVVDKYTLKNGNIGAVVENDRGTLSYLEFQVNSVKPDFWNLYGLLDVSYQFDNIDGLIKPGNYISAKVKYSDEPMYTVQQINYVSSKHEPTIEYLVKSAHAKYGNRFC